MQFVKEIITLKVQVFKIKTAFRSCKNNDKKDFKSIIFPNLRHILKKLC